LRLTSRVHGAGPTFVICRRSSGRAPTGYDGTSGVAATFTTASAHGPGGPGGGGVVVVVGAGSVGLAASEDGLPERGLAVTEPRGSFGPGLDGGAETRPDVARAPADVIGLSSDALAVPCTGCWSSASTRPPISHASSTTASTETTAAAARRRQYTDCGSGPFGSIMFRR
jgi:hypothetical protein